MPCTPPSVCLTKTQLSPSPSAQEDAKGGGGFSKLFNKMKDEEVDYTQHEVSSANNINRLQAEEV